MYLFKEISNRKDSKNLIESNMRLVVYIAKSYTGQGLSYEDLIQEGFVGLCKAQEKYIQKKGQFSSYAGQWIRAYMTRALSNKSRTVRLPVSLYGKDGIVNHTCGLDTVTDVSVDPDIDSTYKEEENKRKVTVLLSKLKGREREIIKMKFGIDCGKMKTKEIANKLKISVQAVNGHIRNSIKKMKI